MKISENLRVFIIGYMGAGKTTVGKLLANKLDWSFIDIDCFIENRYRKTIAAIFEENGEAGFREIERRALQEISNFENVVVSTGGGLPCHFDNMDVMNRTGVTVYLKATVDELLRRLSFDKQKRPLIKGKKPDELRIFVEESLKKREPFYNRATFIFEVQHCSSKKGLNRQIEKILSCESAHSEKSILLHNQDNDLWETTIGNSV
jgi:shikimate kinase